MLDNPGEETTNMDAVPTLEVRIPGPWSHPAELHDALEKNPSGYALAEKGLLHIASGRSFACSATPHDDDIADVFGASGRLSPREVRDIARHKVKVHLSAPGGSVEAAKALMDAVTALIHAGGNGVMIDNSATTHGKDDWLKLAADKSPGGLYWAYVSVADGDDMIWSCGMHCLGLRDAELPDPPTREIGGFVLHNFLGYTYQSGITVLDGETMGGEDGPMFRMRHQPCTRFKPGTPFHNPYGVWRLEAIEE